MPHISSADLTTTLADFTLAIADSHDESVKDISNRLDKIEDEIADVWLLGPSEQELQSVYKLSSDEYLELEYKL